MNSIIIIGAGPAGIACAIQLKRFGVNSVVFEKNEIGGLIKNANLIENYLGFPEGVSGIEYVELIKKQFEQYEIPLIQEEIVKITSNNGFKVETDTNSFECNYLVLATGTKPKKLSQALSSKIFYEVTELSEIENKTIAIIGAGDAAFDYALNLASKNNKVFILNRGKNIKALPLLVKRAENNVNITYLENVDITPNNPTVLSADYILCAIGRETEDSLLTKELKDSHNLFMIGDMKNGILRQTSLATADGLKTATEIYDRINNTSKTTT